MAVEVLQHGAFHSALVRLAPGETFVSDSGAMFRASTNVDIDVSVRQRGGGLLAGLKRMVGGDSFFLSTYSLTGGSQGEVGLAPTLQGQIFRIRSDGGTPWMCTGGSFLGCDGTLTMDTRFQGLKGIFSGENLFFVHLSGVGEILVNAYGRISEVAVDGELVVDTGHVVAFEESLGYRLTKAGGSWLTSFLAGEGFVLHFTGKGRLLVQSHNPKEFGSLLGKHLPPRRR